MPHPLANLTGPGKPLRAEAPERLVADLITAARAVADAMQPPMGER